jgi:Type I restriction enzyme R protein N terminus (HSDR_N)
MSPNLFKSFDFNLLDSPDFKEDSVREELITPLLHTLGYKASGEFRILRSKVLVHPFVMIGATKHKIIIPDYLLKVKNNFAWALDAKSPDQKIVNNTNVEQIYSYAIHPEVRVNLYALCNGRELVVFHVSHIEPILQVTLQDIESRWSEIEKLLSPYNVLSYKPKPRNLYPDYGLHLYKLGYTNQKIAYFFYEMPVTHIDRVDDQTLSILVNYAPDGVEFAISFDFDFERLVELVNLAPESKRYEILDGLTRQPYQVNIVPPFTINLVAYLGFLTKTEFENIIPMIVNKFY